MTTVIFIYQAKMIGVIFLSALRELYKRGHFQLGRKSDREGQPSRGMEYLEVLLDACLSLGKYSDGQHF